MNNEIKFLPPFKRMCMTIGTLPSSFYASMSYYESMVWLYEYLKNEVIPVVNNNSEVAKELQDAFTALETYIENYFDNLDIQEEINVKLDEMAEDGTLADMVAEYIRMQGQLVYNSVAEMKLAENIQNGSFLKTYGFYSYNDGGGALYKARTVTNEDVIDEMTIIALHDNTLVAELVSDKENVLCYGVTANDTNSNNHTIINYVLTKEKSAYCKKDITISSSLILNVANSKFNFTKITYTGDSYAILLNNDYIELTGESLISDYDGLRCGLDHTTQFCRITLDYVETQNIGILLGGTAGVYFNTFDIKHLRYKVNGVKCLLDDYYVGENTFYNVSFTDDSDVAVTEQFAFHCNATNYRATGFRFYNINFEGAKGGFYFEGNNKLCEFLQVYGLRCSELAYTNHKVLKIKCNATTIPLYGDIFFDFAKPSAFDFSEYTVTENTKLTLHGAFRINLNNSNDLLGYEGHPSYTKLVITKLPREYDSFRCSASVNLIQSPILVVNPHQTDPTINVAKFKFGDTDYIYNGNIQIMILNEGVSAIELYRNDGTTLAKSIAVNELPCIINLSCGNLLTSNETQYFYSISNIGTAGRLN